MSDLASPVQPVAQPAIQPAKKSNTGKIVIGCCLVIIVILCMCCSAIFLLFGATANSVMTVYNQVQTSLVRVCDGKETDLRNFYDNTTSKGFKAATTYAEFKTFFTQYQDIILDCTELKAGTFFNTKVNGLKVNMETLDGVQTLNVEYPSKSYTVSVQFIEEAKQWKVSSIEVK